jgi:hypothetical protein
MALAMGAVSVLSTAAWASPVVAEPTAAVAPAAAVSTVPTWGYNDNRHRTNRDECHRFRGHELYDRFRHHWYCHGGGRDGWWY